MQSNLKVVAGEGETGATICADGKCPAGNPPPCEDPARANIHKMQQLGRTLLREVRRLDLNFREYQLAEMLIEVSYGWGKPAVVVPKLEVFSQLIGIAKPHIHTNLAALIEIGLVQVEKSEPGPIYRVTPNPTQWRCRLKVSRSAIKEATNTLKIYNGLDDGDLPSEIKADANGYPSFFDGRDGAEILASVVTESVMVTDELFREGGKP